MPEPLADVDAPAATSEVHALVPREIGHRTFDFAREVAVMAIVNRTPDSFFDQGRTFALDAAIASALEAVENGADLIDIGGAKFAPGEQIPVAEEIERVVPVIEGMRGSGAVISVDTFHPEVAAAAIAAGAHVINGPDLRRRGSRGRGLPHCTHRARRESRSGGVALERIIIDPGHDLRYRRAR